MQVISVRRQQGVGKKSGRNYDFQTVGGLIETREGREYAEVMIDGDAPTPEIGKHFEVQMSFYPDREKRLHFRVDALVPTPAPGKATA